MPAEESPKGTQEGPAVTFVKRLISIGVRERASDIHIEPQEDGAYIRYRIDGVLRPPGKPIPSALGRGVISAIKVMAEMDVAETRLPQDGRIQGVFDGHALDIRVATLPTPYGEKVAMRLLDKSVSLLELEQLGFDNDVGVKFEELVTRPQGMVLVVGPTGSGKTTTLYAALNRIKSPQMHIVTVEDPIEYRIKGITQTQVQPEIGLTFATQLRAILRQDPDVILIGEIRDSETAQIAFRAALTGHLVLSTLHTLDAPSAVIRLLDMGIERYLISGCLSGVLAQRLVRMVCPRCRKRYEPSKEELFSANLRWEDVRDWKFYRGAGCNYCGGSGYRGRTGIFELLIMKGELQEAVHSGATGQELKRIAMDSGMRTLREDALSKVKAGITTLEEMNRIVYEI